MYITYPLLYTITYTRAFFSFVGELYLQKLLSVNIMIGCMRQLISSDHETELESLSKLIPTIGAELEKEQRGQEVSHAQRVPDRGTIL